MFPYQCPDRRCPIFELSGLQDPSALHPPSSTPIYFCRLQGLWAKLKDRRTYRLTPVPTSHHDRVPHTAGHIPDAAAAFSGVCLLVRVAWSVALAHSRHQILASRWLGRFKGYTSVEACTWTCLGGVAASDRQLIFIPAQILPMAAGLESRQGYRLSS